jgi:hypothetical protein
MVNLRDSVLWIGDWVTAAMHDPDFWMMRIWTGRLVSVHFDRDDGCLEVSIRIYPPNFRLHHPGEWAYWGNSPLNYAYPRKITIREGEKTEAIDQIPF